MKKLQLDIDKIDDDLLEEIYLKYDNHRNFKQKIKEITGKDINMDTLGINISRIMYEYTGKYSYL